MRVRTITGTTYYMRSGARITGEVHERFMLIDGNRVATGSYRQEFKLFSSIITNSFAVFLPQVSGFPKNTSNPINLTENS